jgi:hypothetical protein
MKLSLEDTNHFCRLMWGLQRYANRQYQICEDISSPMAYANLPVKTKIDLRNAIWKSPDLVDGYLQANPEGLGSKDIEIVQAWKGYVQDKFFILRHLQKYTIFIGSENKVYAVVGVFDNLRDIIPSYTLPQMVNTTLLPFKGQILFDGLLEGYNISFGGGIRSELDHTYLIAKQKGRIITNLEPESSKTKPAQEAIKTWLPQLEEIASSASKLKGETTLQKTAFNLVRASIEMAKRTETASDDLEVLLAGERKVQKAMNRLYNYLEIELED